MSGDSLEDVTTLTFNYPDGTWQTMKCIAVSSVEWNSLNQGTIIVVPKHAPDQPIQITVERIDEG